MRSCISVFYLYLKEGLVEDLIRYLVGSLGTNPVDANIVANYFLADSLLSSLRQMRVDIQKKIIEKV